MWLVSLFWTAHGPARGISRAAYAGLPSPRGRLEPQFNVGSWLDVPGLPHTHNGGGMTIDACSTIPEDQAGTSKARVGR